MQLLQPILEGKAKSFEVTDAATNKYDEWLQQRLATSVWTECHSYYQSPNNHDEGSKSELEAKPRIVATFPGPVSYFWWMLRKPMWGDYIAVGAEPWFASMRSARRKNAVKLSVFSALLGVAVGVSVLRADELSASLGIANVWERVLGVIYP